METPRRYSDPESSAILKQAAQAQKTQAQETEAVPTEIDLAEIDLAETKPTETHRDGRTFAELKTAGQAAGIAPTLVARAAANVVHSTSTPPPEMRLGQPVGVAHAVDVPGPFTDADWDALVQDLRQTFNAQGTVSQSGASRQWRNGNLRVRVEPRPSGPRIYFSTLHGVLQSRLDASLLLGLASPVGVLVLLFASDVGVVSALIAGGAIGLGAAGSYGISAYQLPSWRRMRKAQMKAIAGRILDRTACDDDSADSPPSESSAPHR